MPTTRSGAPPGETRRPQISAPAGTDLTTASVVDTTDEFRALVDQAAALVEAIAGQGERDAAIDRAAFIEGYRAGFSAGRDVGWQQAEADMQRAWSALAAKVRGWARYPTFQQLEQLRYPGLTTAEILRLRGRDKYPLPPLRCGECGGITSEDAA